MSTTSLDPRISGPRRAPTKRLTFSWADPRLRAIVWQILIVGVLVGVLWLIAHTTVGSSRVDLQACKLEYSIVSPK